MTPDLARETPSAGAAAAADASPLAGPDELFRALLAGTSDAVFVRDLEGRYRVVNEAAAAGIRRPVAEILGRTPRELLGAEAGDAFERNDREVLRTGAPVTVVARLSPWGEERFYHCTLGPVRDTAGDVVGTFGVARDVTGRVKSGRRLSEERHRLRLLLQQVPGMVWTTDRDLRMVTADGSSFTAAQFAESIGLDLRALAAAEPGYEPVVAGHERALAGGTGEYEVVTTDGRTMWARVEPIRDDNGAVAGVVGAAVDITAIKVAERDLRARARAAALGAEVAGAAVTGGPLRAVLGRCAAALVKHLDAAFARVWTLDERQSVLTLEASAGLYTHLDGKHARIALGALKIGRIAAERRPHVSDDLGNDPQISDPEWARREGMVAFAGYPLVVEDRLQGVVAMFSRSPLDAGVVDALGGVADRLALVIDRDRTARQLQARAEERRRDRRARRRLLRRVVTAQEEERRRIARELHDHVGQQIATLALGLRVVEREVRGAGARRRLAELGALCGGMSKSLHDMALELRPTALDDFGLRSALDTLVATWSARTGVRATLDCDCEPGERFPPAVETAAYRVVQEALTNVARHAAASRVAVTLVRAGAHLFGVVDDDGVGFDASSRRVGDRLGLLGMYERAAELGGALDVASAPACGTVVLFRLPAGEWQGGAR